MLYARSSISCSSDWPSQEASNVRPAAPVRGDRPHCIGGRGVCLSGTGGTGEDGGDAGGVPPPGSPGGSGSITSPLPGSGGKGGSSIGDRPLGSRALSASFPTYA